MSGLEELLEDFRNVAKSEHEKGAYFENLVKVYLQNEPLYRDMFGGKVFLWPEWRKYWQQLGNPDPGPDAGIDLVALQESDGAEANIFAMQAKFYNEEAKIRKDDGIDSFLSAMGKKPFTHGMLFLTSYAASNHVNELIKGRDKPVNIVGLTGLENSLIDWSVYRTKKVIQYRNTKTVRDYQRTAIQNVLTGLKQADRGKLIMACGTGKTFTTLRLAEEQVGRGGLVLFLVPSLSLLSQTLREWTQEAEHPIRSFAVCSDSQVGKIRDDQDDFQLLTHELQFPDKGDKSRVVYNHKITMTAIPLEAYDYVVNGKPALEWVMERQAVTTHKDSGIVNDANLWATETMCDASYPLKLFQRVITVSLETMKIVRGLPRLEIIHA